MQHMRLPAYVLIITLAVFTLSVAACGDDDEDGDASVTPTATGSPSATNDGESPTTTPSLTIPPGGTETPGPTSAAPTPGAPPLPAGVTQITEGTMNFVVISGGQFSFDGQGLVQPGTQPPPCETFVFAFAWQITDPFPPGDNSVTWRVTQQGATNDIASGADGSATTGCGLITAVNTGLDQVTVNVRYILGQRG